MYLEPASAAEFNAQLTRGLICIQTKNLECCLRELVYVYKLICICVKWTHANSKLYFLDLLQLKLCVQKTNIII